MNKRRFSLLLVIVLVVSLAVPSVVDARAMTQQEAAGFLLSWIGYSDQEIEAAGGIDAAAKYVGLIDGTYEPAAPCSNDQYEAMRQIALSLYDARPVLPTEPIPTEPVPTEPEPTESQPTEPVPTEPQPTEPAPTEPVPTEPQPTEPAPTEPKPVSPMQFQDGLAQPIFNINRDIERFCVYVETDYDTDADGRLDLIKVVVQLPTAAMNGDYKAGVIYEARPYIAGTGYSFSGSGTYSEDNLYKTAAPRTPRGTATTAEVAANANSRDYNFYEDIDWYDYFLVRGFAVVTAAGLGTKGSEGFETCGTDLEIDAFASVIEWLNGSPDAVAYTNRTDNIQVDADWSNGKVGMTGRSYAGTTQFGLAASGVQGLETIVPVSGIASWYDYTNSQGYRTRSTKAYSEWLASYCASRAEDSDWNKSTYAKYLNAIANDETKLNGDYGEHFRRRDYTLNPNIHCSALIVHGLNDDNVRTKHFQMMYDAFTNAGQNVKLLLHQDGHVTPAYGDTKTEQFINGEAYQQVLNRWFSHYLFDINNGAENMAAVTAQSNQDGSWDTYDSWETANTLTMNTSTMKVNQELTIQGTIPVTVKATPSSTSSNNLLNVKLVDTYGSRFNSYPMSSKYVSSNHVSTGQRFEVGGGADPYTVVKLRGQSTTSKVIAEGWIDLANPSAGFASSTAVKETIRKGQQYAYTVYLQPTVYKVAPGHTLKLQVTASNGKVNSYSAVIPVREAVAAPTAYTVSYAPEENGTIISNVPSGEMVDANTSVTFSANPNTGYEFSSWSVNGKEVSGEATATFTITEDTSITASFAKQQVSEPEEEAAPSKPSKPNKPSRPGRPSWPSFSNRPGRPSWFWREW